MYVNDPFELAQLPVREEDQFAEEDEGPSLEDIFFEHHVIPHSSVGFDIGAHTGVCRLDGDGNHTYMDKNCQHFEAEDEEGKRIAKGWTVQSGRTN